MILVADGGSTKAHWALITKDLNIKEFYTEGYNPYFVSEEYIIRSLRAALPADLVPERIEKLYFYGAGVPDEEKARILESSFAQIFPQALILIEHDLLASCRALLADKEGFAAILGTGTNTCLYNGEEMFSR